MMARLGADWSELSLDDSAKCSVGDLLIRPHAEHRWMLFLDTDTEKQNKETPVAENPSVNNVSHRTEVYKYLTSLPTSHNFLYS